MPGGIRTHNLLIRSQMLYPVELQTRRNFDLRFWIFDSEMQDRQMEREIENRQLKIRDFMGGRRDSNPQQPEPQSGALPLSYDHRLNYGF